MERALVYFEYLNDLSLFVDYSKESSLRQEELFGKGKFSTSLPAKRLLPMAYHHICHGYRKRNDLGKMTDFMIRFNKGGNFEENMMM